MNYTTDGDCQNWNQLIPGVPARINLSNIEGLELDKTGFSTGTNYSFAIRFRIPDLIQEEDDGDNPDELLYLNVENKDDPMVLWNIYDQDIAFFPADADSSITRSHIASENSGFLVG